MTDNVTQLPRKPATNAERQAKHRQRKAAAKAAAAAAVTPPAVPAVTSTVMPAAANWQHSGAVAFVALAGALALTSVDAVFGTVGMTAIFPGAVVPVMVMTGVLEGTKIITAAWLARHWRNAPLTLRVPLIGVILVLMLLSGIGTHGFLARAHLEPLAVATDAIDREAAPIAQRIAIAASDLRDLDARVAQLDEIIKWRRVGAPPRPRCCCSPTNSEAAAISWRSAGRRPRGWLICA